MAGLTLFSVAPRAAFADGTYNGITIKGGTEGTDYEFTNSYTYRTARDGSNTLATPCIIIKSSTPMELSGASSTTGITIAAGVEAHLTFAGLNISGNLCPVNIESGGGQNGATLHLTLADESTNTLRVNLTDGDQHGGHTAGNSYAPGIRCGEGATLYIDDAVANVDASGNAITPKLGRIPAGTTYTGSDGVTRTAGTNPGDDRLTLLDSLNAGKLIVRGGYRAAGIGGGPRENGGNITINGGLLDVTASSKNQDDDDDNKYGNNVGAAIGGGGHASGGNITINGGEIVAQASYHGAAIGSGTFWGLGCNAAKEEAKDRFDDAKLNEENVVAGNITVNGGRTVANGAAHGNAFGQGCGGNNSALGCEFIITGGTLLPSSVDGRYDIGGRDGYVYVLGGSVRLSDSSKFQSVLADGHAYGNLDRTTEVVMTQINIAGYLGYQDDVSTSGVVNNNRIAVLDMAIGGLDHEYGLPHSTDDAGNLYLWLPQTINGQTTKEVSVDLGALRYSNGEYVEITGFEPFFIPENPGVSYGTYLKQYSIFDITNGNLDAAGIPRSQRYNGTGLGVESAEGKTPVEALTAALAAANIAVRNPENQQLSNANSMTVQNQAVDNAGNPDGAIEDDLPADVGDYRLIVTSTEFATGAWPAFQNSFWGHRGYYQAVSITPAESLTEVVGVKVADDGSVLPLDKDEDGNVIDVSAADTLRFYANVSPYYTLDDNDNVIFEDEEGRDTRTITDADGNEVEVPLSEATTCEAPEGEVDFYLYYQDGGTSRSVFLGTKELSSDRGDLYNEAEAGNMGYNYATASYDLDLSSKRLFASVGGRIPEEFTVVAVYKAADSSASRNYTINYNASSGDFPTTAEALRVRGGTPTLVVADRNDTRQGAYTDVTAATLVNNTTTDIPTEGSLATNTTKATDWATSNAPESSAFIGWTDNPRTTWNLSGTDRIIEDWEVVGSGVRRIYPVYSGGSVSVDKSVTVPEGYAVMQDGNPHPYVGGKLHYAIASSVSGKPTTTTTLTISDRLPAQVELNTSSVKLTYADGESIALRLADALADDAFTYDADTRVLTYQSTSFDVGSLPRLEFDVNITGLADGVGGTSRVISNGATVAVDDWVGHGSCVAPLVFDGPNATDAILLACWRETQVDAADSGPNYPELGYVSPNLVIGEQITLRTPQVASITGYDVLKEYYPDGSADPGTGGSTTATISANTWALTRAAQGGPMPDDDDTNGTYWAFLGWTDNPRTSWNPNGTDRLLGAWDVVQPGVNRIYPVYGLRAEGSGDGSGTGGEPAPGGPYIMEKGLITHVETVTIYQELEYKVAAHNLDPSASWANITFMDKFPAYAELVPGSVHLAIVDYSGLTSEQLADGVDGVVLREYALEPSTGGATWEAGRYNYDSSKHMISHRILKDWLNDNPITIETGQSCELRFKIYVTREYLEVTTEKSDEELENEGWVSWGDPDGGTLWVGGDTAPIGHPGDSKGDRWIGKEAENLTLPGAAARIGDRIQYTITVGNDKSYRWEDVRIRDAVPAGLDVDTSTLRITGPDGVGHVVDASAWHAETRELIVSAGSLEEGESAKLTFEVVVSEEAAKDGTDIGNVASAEGSDPWTCVDPPSIGDPVGWPWGSGSGTGSGTGTGTGVGTPIFTSTCYPPHTTKGPIPYPESGPRLTNICEPNDPDILTKTVEVHEDPSYKEVLRYTVTLHNPTPGSRWNDMEIFDYLPEELVYIRGTLRMTYPDGRTVSISDVFFDEETHIFEVPVGTVRYGETYVMEYDVGVPTGTRDEIELVNRAKVNVPSDGIPRTEDPFLTLAGLLPLLTASGVTSLAGGTVLRRKLHCRGRHSS